MASNESIEANVRKEINEEIGSDGKNLYRAAVLVDRYRDRLKQLEKKMNCKESSAVKRALETLRQACEAILIQQTKLQSYNEKLSVYLDQIKSSLEDIQPELAGLMKLDHCLQYLHIVQDIQEISRNLQETLEGSHDFKNAMLITIYMKLYTEPAHGDCILSCLNRMRWEHLKSFALQTTIYWHSVLEDHFMEQFQQRLALIQWGRKSIDLSSYDTTSPQMNSTKSIAQYLFLLRLPTEAVNTIMDTDKICGRNTNIVFPPLSNLSKCLLTPFKERFAYHFSGTKQTNRLDKPEWVFTQVSNWIKSTHKFVGKAFQAVINKTGHDFNIRVEFIRGMVQMVVEKLIKDIEEISEDKNLFAHLIDEVVAFDMELHDNYGYPSTFPSPMSVITQPVYLLKWISIEEEFCSEQLDMILEGENPWELINGNIFNDELKIPKCADLFIRLLVGIKERYYYLIQPGHQLQFLNLQLELIENYRMRLVQLYNNHLVDIIAVLNAVNYIKMVLVEWGESVHYLHLHAALIGQIEDSLNSVFDKPILELTHWFHQLLNELVATLTHEIKANCLSYRNEGWSQMPKHEANEYFTLSSSAAAMFETMNALNDYENRMSANIFALFVRSIAEELDEYLLYIFIMNAKFSAGGAAQFNYDLTRNLLPLFGRYYQRPDLLFKMTNDANKLLNFSNGTALLLYENLKGNASTVKKLNMLKETGIVYLKNQICMDVLERRTDIQA